MTYSLRAALQIAKSADFAESGIDPLPLETGEQRLFWAVILRAIFDATYQTSESNRHFSRKAKDWIFSNSEKDFSFKFYARNLFADPEDAHEKIKIFVIKKIGSKRKDLAK